jgi:CheY-like chemotaxis protein
MAESVRNEVHESTVNIGECHMMSEDGWSATEESRLAWGGQEKIKVLVVEDDLTTQLLYNKGLFDQVFDKKMVVSGKEALYVYNEWQPDIIILDIYLPEITGYKVLHTIRTNIEDKKTTIVMATALSGKEDILSCLKLGIEGYIVKPFKAVEIGLKILNYYGKKEPDRAQRAEALLRELVKQSHVQERVEKDKPKAKENAEGTSDTTDVKTKERGAEEKASFP